MKMSTEFTTKFMGGFRNPDDIKAIAFHYTANSGSNPNLARANARYFRDGCPDANGKLRYASAHIVVDSKNIAYLCVPLNRVAWAVGDSSNGKLGKLYGNYNTISIEMVSNTDKDGNYYIPEQTKINAAIVYRKLIQLFPNAATPIRHYDVSGKLCPWPMVDEAAWEDFKENYLNKEWLEMTKEELLTTAGTGDNPSAWAKKATEYCKKAGIFSGDGKGNYGWQTPITREALAQVIYNMTKEDNKNEN